MKFLHLADLHIGKRLNEFLMLEDQSYALEQVLKICSEKNIDAVLISGDIYDRSIPTAEAVKLFDMFLTKLSEKNIIVFIISGNHDSPQRLEFGAAIMQNKNVYIESVFKGGIKKITLNDEYGSINVYMLPFIRPGEVKGENSQTFDDYTAAADYLIGKAAPNKTQRNIIMSHQFVVSADEEPQRCDSEVIAIGGLDSIESYVYNGFDYVALGHLHSPQRVGSDNIRYSGSLLKYSFSEIKHKKSVPVVTMKKKGDINIELVPITPLRDMRQVKGKIDDIILQAKTDKNSRDYIKAIITDEDEVYDAIGRLRAVYPNIMKIEFENKRSVFNEDSKTAPSKLIGRSPLELFDEFFKLQNNVEMNEEQKKIVFDIFKEMENDEDEAY